MTDIQTTPVVQAEDTVLEVPVYPETESDYGKKPRKRRIFWKLFWAYFALLLVASVFLLWFFFQDLQRYEANTPNSALNTYIDWVKNGDFEAIYSASDFEESILNTKEEYIKYLATMYTGDTDTLVVREKATSHDNQKDYSLYLNNTRVAAVSLLKNPDWGETAWSYVTDIHYIPTTTIYAAEGIRLSINGVDTTLLNLTGTPVQTQVLGKTDMTDILPTIYSYTITDLLNPPTIEGLTLSGDPCTVVQDETGAYHVLSAANETVQAERQEHAKNVAFTYARFISRDDTRENLLKLVAKNSDLYEKLRVFSNDWFSRHDSVDFRNLSITNYRQYSATDFSCDISFLPVYLRGGQEKEAPVFHNRLSFVLIDEEWKLFAMTQLNAEPTDPDDTQDLPEE